MNVHTLVVCSNNITTSSTLDATVSCLSSDIFEKKNAQSNKNRLSSSTKQEYKSVLIIRNVFKGCGSTVLKARLDQLHFVWYFILQSTNNDDDYVAVCGDAGYDVDDDYDDDDGTENETLFKVDLECLDPAFAHLQFQTVDIQK